MEIEQDSTDWKTFTLFGELVLSSYQDASYVISEGGVPLGRGILDEGTIDEAIDHEVMHYRHGTEDEGVLLDKTTIEVTLSEIENEMYGAGFIRAGFDGSLEVTATDVDVEFQTTDGEWHHIRIDVPATIEFNSVVTSAYDALDDPDRYVAWDHELGEPLVDEGGHPVYMDYVDKEDQTFYTY